MFGVESVAHAISNLLTTLRAACCWIIFSPLILIPRRRDWIVIIGREEGKFIDNTKYFFLSAARILEGEMRVVLLTERDDVLRLLANSKYEALHFPTWASIWLLLRAGTVVVDSVEWTRHGRCYLLLGAKSIQLWHGVGYKRIELDQWRYAFRDSAWAERVLRFPLLLIRLFVTARLFYYDAVVAPSSFYRDNVFKKAFLSRQLLVCGYPRNAPLKTVPSIFDVVWLNVDLAIVEKARGWLNDGRRMVLIAPTFRDSGDNAISLMPTTMAMLDVWCNQNKVEFVFKLHPFDKTIGRLRGKHLHLCEPSSDPYPLMSMSSALITDHSSIYMDYLIVDKPLLFISIDWDYTPNIERQFQFEPGKMMPGPRASSWASLLRHLEAELEDDSYREARSRLKRLAFDDLPQESAVEVIVEYMRAQRWIPTL